MIPLLFAISFLLSELLNFMTRVSGNGSKTCQDVAKHLLFKERRVPDLMNSVEL